MQKSSIVREYRGGGYLHLRYYKGLSPLAIVANLSF